MKRFLLVTAAVVLTVSVAPAAEPYPFTVTVVGSGRPVVFIPGFGCSGDVWKSTVEHFKDKCECHVLTLSGFAGVPPKESSMGFLETAVQGIAAYAKDKNLSNAVVVGHSLGAHLAVRVAAAAPDQFSAAVLVDGFPAFMALMQPDTKPEDWKKFGEGRREHLAKLSKEEFLKEMRDMFSNMLAGERLEEAMKWLAATDQPTAAKAMGELFIYDARPDAAKVRGPVLILGAFNDWLKKYGVPSADALEKGLKPQLKEAKDGRVAVHPDCRHFIMYEQPKWMFEHMEKVMGK